MKRMVSLFTIFSFIRSCLTFVSHTKTPFYIKSSLNVKPLDVSKDFITRGLIGSEWTYNDFLENLKKIILML